MKRRIALIPAALLAVFLDCFVLPSLTLSGVRPLFTLSLALAATAATKVQDGMLIAFFGGLLSDLFFHPYLGLSAAAYLVAVVILYGFTHRRDLKLSLVPLCAFVAAAAAEAIIFAFSLAVGARFDALLLLRTTLPSTVLEALIALPLAALFRSRGKGGSKHS
jgi:rod shape-determining protein MreD